MLILQKMSEKLYSVALNALPGLNPRQRATLLQAAGSATAVFEHRHEIQDIIPSASPRLTDILAGMEQQLPRAERELAFAQRGLIQVIPYTDGAYPHRLRQCPDAPVVLFYRGNADLNASHVVAMVGTRQITDYGKYICEDFIEQLSLRRPDCLVVSGLAYGVDIHCHRASLRRHLPTIGILAHGLDQIYPTRHRSEAIEMLDNGGLLTEFMSETRIDKAYFLQRNRIVAGMADATIVVESAAKGGSLVTADIAGSYHREVFAFPGRIDAPCSVGCNALISRHQASMLTSADDFIDLMGWENHLLRQQQLTMGVQQDLFPQLTPEEQAITDAMRGHDAMHINDIATLLAQPVHRVSSLLFTMEMKGIVRKSGSNMFSL